MKYSNHNNQPDDHLDEIEPVRREGSQPARSQLPPRATIRLPKLTPWVTYVMLVMSVLMYMFQITSEATLGFDLPAALGMKINELIAMGEYWRLLTPMFLHGSIFHIGFNMYALFIFGPLLERHFGHKRFLALYLLSGFAGNVISLMFTIQPSLGSSTAIFGLLGGQAVFMYRNQKIFGGIARRALSNIISIAVINLLIGLSPGIDNWGHVGGLVGGALFAWGGGPLYRIEGVMPVFSLADEREPAEIIQAGVGVLILYIVLALASLYLLV